VEPRLMDEEDFWNRLASELKERSRGSVADESAVRTEGGFLQATIGLEFRVFAKAGEDPTLPAAWCCVCYQSPAGYWVCAGDCCGDVGAF
jgi:hypothetical protein